MRESPEVNLFIIGAMKSGTTSLHNYLATHPDIFMCEPKEPGFFVEELTWAKGLDWYRSLFADAQGKAVVGESSTHYTKLPVYRGVPERIAEFNPNARFIYLMRDPVDRAVSHYWHNVRDLTSGRERRDMLTAMQRDPQYVAFSDYAMQLKPYMEIFGRERIFVATFERMVADPAGVVGEIFSWLRVDGSFQPEDLHRRWNAAPEELSRVRGLGILNRIRYSRAWDRLAPAMPGRLRRLGIFLAEKPVGRASQDETAAQRYLRPILRGRVEEIRSLLGRDFNEWITLYR